jgi:hypothetical protein
MSRISLTAVPLIIGSFSLSSAVHATMVETWNFDATLTSGVLRAATVVDGRPTYQEFPEYFGRQGETGYDGLDVTIGWTVGEIYRGSIEVTYDETDDGRLLFASYSCVFNGRNCAYGTSNPFGLSSPYYADAPYGPRPEYVSLVGLPGDVWVFGGNLSEGVLGYGMDSASSTLGNALYALDPNLDIIRSSGLPYNATYSASFSVDNIDYSISEVPLPGAVWLFGSAIAGAGLFGRLKKKRAQPAIA